MEMISKEEILNAIKSGKIKILYMPPYTEIRKIQYVKEGEKKKWVEVTNTHLYQNQLVKHQSNKQIKRYAKD